MKLLAVSTPAASFHRALRSSVTIKHGNAIRSIVPRFQASKVAKRSVVAEAMKALVWDCDGVILESEDLHRQAYNAVFRHFDVRIDGKVVDWSIEFYDDLQNRIGGGKPKMNWFFGQHAAWPTSKVFDGRAPHSKEEQTKLVDVLQDWKTEHYQVMIKSGQVPPRPGVLRLMDEARAAGLKVAVCSAATKASVVTTLNSLIGPERFHNLDVFLAGDDVDKKKPDPTIYKVAAQKLGVEPSECVVVEDSTIGLQAALGAGMRCIITYTHSTKSQAFIGAERVIANLGENPVPMVTIEELQSGRFVQDDRVEAVMTDSSVQFFKTG